MAEPTGAEILMWSLINRARLDPNGEAARYGITLNEGPVTDFSNPPQVVTLTGDSKQPLAWNSSLFTAADGHSQDMIDRDFFAHTDPATGSTPQSRAAAAGYAASPFRWVGENIDLIENTNPIDATAAVIEQERKLFVDSTTTGRGHRYNILLDDYSEVGVGQVIGTYQGFNASAITQDFGKPASGATFLTGIAYTDTVTADSFYTVGEGRGGVSVATSAGTVFTGTAGAYSQAIGAGVQTVTFSGGGLPAPVTVNVTITAGRNALVDMVGTSTVETSASLVAGANVTKIVGLGNIGLSLTGNDLANTIVSALGNDSIDGGNGTDTVVYTGKMAEYTITPNAAAGTVTVTGHGQTDTLKSIEKLQFDDQPFTLPGGAVAGSVSISDVTLAEGNAGTTKDFTFNVIRAAGSGTAAFDVSYAIVDSSATVADGDYQSQANGVLHFGDSVNTQTVTVKVNGDAKFEGDDKFFVNLSNATNGATISDSQGVGTITNDDAAPVAGSVSISDVTLAEGNAGTTKDFTFNVIRAAGSGTAAFDVSYAIADSIATVAGGDYQSQAGGVLHFGAGVNSQSVTVKVNGDATFEGDEKFFVNLSNATNGATITKAQGVGTITNDDAAPVAGSVSINDVTLAEGNTGTKDFTFNVIRAAGSGTAAFDVSYAIADSSATVADGDYQSQANGVLHFGAGVNTQTVTVKVNGDATFEGDDKFFVNLSNATNGATISDSQGVGTITNDDSAPTTNTAPVVTAHDVIVGKYGSIAASSMFEAHDQQGDSTITKYAFWDGDSAGGHFTVNGAAQAAGQWIYVNAANLGSVAYVGGASAGAESLYVVAYDGQAWSDFDGLTARTVTSPNDFNGDGMSDILWRSDNGALALWQMNGTQAHGDGIANVGADWHIDGKGDFNGDGKGDLLWRQDGGLIALWQMNGATFKGDGVGSVGSDWHISGIGDFNGDDKSDILWRHDSGAIALWQMNGTQFKGDGVGAVGADWQIAGIGDFNGDGKSDILWRHDSGAIALWQMNGTQFKGDGIGSVGSDWHIANVGDFNGDGNSDILWRNDNGSVATWQMNGTQVTSNGVGSASAAWHIADVGDYNGDGNSDVLWRNDNGTVAMWQMDGAHIMLNTTVAGVSNDWHLV